MNKTQPNARFWFHWDGDFVKLTLKPGDEVELYESHSHEEGWSSRHEYISYEDGVVTRTSTSDGRDCDGRLTQTTVSECSVEKLNSRDPYDANDPTYCPEPGAKFPDWDRVRARQHDYSAEAMGY